MIALGYYLLKIMIGSGALFLYYHIALRNKVFHRWNRFYLLAVVLLSLLLPCLHFNIGLYQNENSKAIHILRVVSAADEYVVDASNRHTVLSTEQWMMVLYTAISCCLLILLLYSLKKIYHLIRTGYSQRLNHIQLIDTDAKGTPFSFFHFIFWNNKIDLHSETGRLILKHELVHVQEKHTLDKLLMQTVLIFFWCNPFFWLIRKELSMIHEFIADGKAVAEQGTEAFAAMILQSVYPQQYGKIANPFFQTSIKRRLIMLTKIQNPKISYFSRILALPLLALIGLAFTLKTKSNSGKLLSLFLEKQITVVIDAGHGGNTGASEGGLYEDALALDISKKIKELNSNDKIHIVLTRSENVNMPLKDRVKIAADNKADLFISIHLNAMPPDIKGSKMTESKASGFDVIIPVDSFSYINQSKTLSYILVQQLSSVYKTDQTLKQKQVGIWVLGNNVCPAVMVQCGYITNAKDREFIEQDTNQKAVAEKILNAIEQYAAADKSNGDKSLYLKKDTTPQTIFISPVMVRDKDQTIVHRTITTKDGTFKGLIIVDGQVYKGKLDDLDASNIKSMSVLKGENAIGKYGEKAKNGAIEIITKANNAVSDAPPKALTHSVTIVQKQNNTDTSYQNPLIVVDGVVKGKKNENSSWKEINPNQIESVSILKGASAIAKYGAKGKDGVVEIKMKDNGAIKDTVPKLISDTVQNYQTNTISLNEAKKQKGAIIIVDGKPFTDDINHLPFKEEEIKYISLAKNMIMLTKSGEEIKRDVISMETKKHFEEKQKNRKLETQPVFSQTEVEAKFPGGVNNWRSYLQKNLNTSAPVQHGAPEGSYTVMIQFLVDIEGNVSDIKALTHRGYGMEEEVINLIKKGPKWIPAEQNGQKVTAYKKQPVTFVISEEKKGNNKTSMSKPALYMGIENPLTINVPNIPNKDLIVTMSQGSLTKRDGKYIANINHEGEAIVFVSRLVNGKEKLIEQFIFDVKPKELQPR